VSVTTVGPVKAQLLALWSAALPAVQITYGRRVLLSAGERVTIGGVTGETMPQSLGPARQMRENYDVKCHVSVTQNGTVDVQQAVTERVLAIYATLEQTLRVLPNQNLGLPAVDVEAIIQGPWELGESDALDTAGPVNSWYEFNVHIKARFRLP
jgi:hypothetical protein